eukprot:46808-Eustigmatos_ZCMA.PRE.1
MRRTRGGTRRSQVSPAQSGGRPRCALSPAFACPVCERIDGTGVSGIGYKASTHRLQRSSRQI